MTGSLGFAGLMGIVVASVWLVASCGSTRGTNDTAIEVITIDWRGQNCDLAVISRGAGTGLTTLGCY